MKWMGIFCDMFSRYMGVGVLLVASLAMFCPELFSMLSGSIVPFLLGIIMFGMGMNIEFDDFKQVIKSPKNIIIGCLTQFLIMPTVAWLLVKLFQLPPDLALGVLLVGCCPGGTASNVMTYLAKGDLALSVGMTTVSTLLAPALTPLLVWLLAGAFVPVDMAAMFMSVLQVIILPIVLGFVVKKNFSGFSTRITLYLPSFSAVAIMLIVAIVVSSNAEKLLHEGLVIVLIVVLHNMFGLLLGFSAGKLVKMKFSQCVAISIEVGMQNSGLACSLANMHFSAFPLASVPGAVFSVWHNISGALVAHLFRRFNH